MEVNKQEGESESQCPLFDQSAVVEEMAADYGLKPVSHQDLTPFMELGRPRDKFIELMYNLGRKAMMKSLRKKQTLSDTSHTQYHL